MEQHILVVDDDPDLRDFLEDYFADHGFKVTGVPDGIAMRRVLADEEIDLIVLDLNLPGESGFDLARSVRNDSNIPIIMLTGRSDETDRVVGLELGADDYVAKPFSARELLARVGAVLRRVVAPGEGGPGAMEVNVCTFENWRMDFTAGRLTSPDGEEVKLTTGEYKLLTAFLTHANRVLSRDQILNLTGGLDSDVFDRSIDIQVMRLRRKIEPVPDRPAFIETVRGLGYVFRPPVKWV